MRRWRNNSRCQTGQWRRFRHGVKVITIEGIAGPIHCTGRRGGRRADIRFEILSQSFAHGGVSLLPLLNSLSGVIILRNCGWMKDPTLPISFCRSKRSFPRSFWKRFRRFFVWKVWNRWDDRGNERMSGSCSRRCTRSTQSSLLSNGNDSLSRFQYLFSPLSTHFGVHPLEVTTSGVLHPPRCRNRFGLAQ